MSRPTLRGHPAASSGSLRAGMLFDTVMLYGGQEGVPPGLPPPPKERGSHSRKSEKIQGTRQGFTRQHLSEMGFGIPRGYIPAFLQQVELPEESRPFQHLNV